MDVGDPRPYKGPDSFQPEDSHLFHGRDAETDHVVALVLSGSMSVLHAQSGAGKTSLLNARLLPELERRGWTPVRIQPGTDPIESARRSLLDTLLPPPAAEAAVLATARQDLFEDGEDPTVDELLARYDDLSPTDRRRTRLARPPRLEPKSAAQPALLCRLFRTSLDLGCFEDHLQALYGPAHPGGPIGVAGSTRVSQLAALLADPALAAGHRTLREELDVSALRLAPFVQRLLSLYLPAGRPCRVVLLLDQFEEVFTRFSDSQRLGAPESARDAPSFDLRDELFRELIDLYRRSNPQPQGTAWPDPRLSLRFLISMRSEYIARLDDELRGVVPSLLSERAYYLPLLTREQAAEAIQRPADSFGYRYAPECFGALIDQLTKERKWVEPAHLQIVCDKLWEEGGRHLAGSGGEVTVERLTALGGAAGILASFFESFLKDLDPSEVYEVLEMLRSLVTTARTRNIVERRVLVETPLRDAALRRVLLDRLVNHTIVRIERRLDSEFVEITHEFLIRPILDAVERRIAEHRAFADLQRVRRTLDSLLHMERAGTDQKLTWHELQLLHAHRDRVRWNAEAREAVFRGAIWLGADREVLATWVEELAKTRDSRDIVAVLADKERLLNPLTRDELRAVQENRDSMRFPERRLELLLRSVLSHANPAERDEVVYWTRRAQTDADEPYEHRA